MRSAVCCVLSCKNNSFNSDVKFYKFPTSKHKTEQRARWISAVRKINDSRNNSWYPKTTSLICSAHFINNKKSEEVLSPSYVPTKFSSTSNNKKNNIEICAINRHERFMRRRSHSTNKQKYNYNHTVEIAASNDYSDNIVNDNKSMDIQENLNNGKVDQACQVSIISRDSISEPSKSFTCNRYTFKEESSDAEVQTDIYEGHIVVIPSQKVNKNRKCGTPHKEFVDASVGPDSVFSQFESDDKNYFGGYASIKKDEQLLDLAGVTEENFNILLEYVKPTSEHCKIHKKDRLLIFLMKLKTGLTFCAISVLFSIHRTSVSNIFYSTLSQVCAATANFVFWPDKDTVRSSMPQCFYPLYANTRVIIDCTEFRIEVPASVENRVFCYSHYKKSFTAKVLIGITPSGFISFKSKVAGGRKSDCQITLESGLINLLESGDTVLADKGFPDIRKSLDESGKEILLVMPPFLEKKSEFTEAETEETYNIARVRIHVERIMQRLRTYNILNKIPDHLFHCIDDIVHMCCVLVNLQPPIIVDKESD